MSFMQKTSDSWLLRLYTIRLISLAMCHPQQTTIDERNVSVLYLNKIVMFFYLLWNNRIKG
jgi:hypothetical protein